MAEMKALFLVENGFEDLQFFCPWCRLQEEGIQITVAAPSASVAIGLHGYKVEPDMPIHELNPAEYDLLVIPAFMEEGRLVALIGHGAQLLISAGALDGRALTCAPGIRDDVRAAGGIYREEGVVVDGILISSRSSEDLPRFCRQIVTALAART
jgi:protease I